MKKSVSFETAEQLIDRFGTCLQEHDSMTLISENDAEVVVGCRKCGRVYGFSRSLWDSMIGAAVDFS